MTFAISAVDELFDDGNRTPTISVSATGFAGDQETITIADDDTSGPPDDILLFDEASRTFKLGTNTGNAFNWFQTNALPAPTSGFDSFIGDFDGDGDLDGAVRNRDTNIVNVYTNNGDGTLTGPIGRGSAGTAGTPGFFQIGDYDGNGREELALAVSRRAVCWAGLHERSWCPACHIQHGQSEPQLRCLHHRGF